MKHYEKLLELGCFSKNDLEQITGSEAAAKWLCREYQKKGYIERVKRDLYVAISLETQQPIANRYVIASHIRNGIRVTTLERTVIDSINLFEKIGGLEELLRCLALIPTLDEAALSACLAEYESGFLYQKTGYILSAFAASLGLSDSFFAMCKSHLPKGKSYLSSESQGFIWHEDWKLYAPKNLMHMIDKGVTDYDAI